MELLPIAAFAWQRRRALALGLPLALLVVLVVGRGAPGHAGVATTRLVIDTPVSQLVNVTDPEVDNLGWRSEILTNLMTTRLSRDAIARETGVDPDALEVANPLLNVPVLPMTLPRRATQSIAPSAPNLLIVTVTAPLPIVTLAAYAPSRTAAERLLRAGAQRMTQLAATPPGMRGAQPIVVKPTAIDSMEVAGRSRTGAVLAGLMALAAWCAAVLLLGQARGMLARVAARSPEPA